MRGYREALEAAGATVIVMEEFGSYQGEWWALVDYQGKRGWIPGAYGSCSGCDAFDSEFGYGDEPTQEQLATFGREYLDDMLDQGAAEAKARENLAWDMDASAMVDFIEKHKTG